VEHKSSVKVFSDTVVHILPAQIFELKTIIWHSSFAYNSLQCRWDEPSQVAEKGEQADTDTKPPSGEVELESGVTSEVAVKADGTENGGSKVCITLPGLNS
jgi:hypothetical protein